MEEKLVKVLLEKYKHDGVDLYALLDNKMFIDLPLEKKVNLIKKYAEHIKSGTSKGLTKKDINALIFETAFAGITSGILAGQGIKHATKYLTNGKVPMGALIGAIAIGAGVSGIASYMGNKRLIKNKQTILKKLSDVERDPSDENAIKVLTTRGFQTNHTPATSISSSAKKNLGERLGSLPHAIRTNIRPFVAEKTFLNNLDGSAIYAPDFNEDKFLEGFYENNKYLAHSLGNYQRSILER